MDRDAFFHLAKSLLSQPTAPFHEKAVAEVILGMVEGYDNLSAQYDRFGNLIVKYLPDEDGLSLPADAPLVAVAHMDHPGIEIAEVRDGLTLARFHGGVGAAYFRNAKVVIHTDRGPVAGAVTDLELEDPPPPPSDIPRNPLNVIDGAPARKRPSLLTLSVADVVKPGDFGHFDFGGYEESGELIRGRAMDDLAGCVVVLATLLSLAKSREKTRFWAVFTRAEECGFIGATALMTEGMIPKDAVMVSVEASSRRAGVVVGGGPVIRLGDRMSVFNLSVVNHLREAAAQMKETVDAFRVQQRILDGGTCEASVFMAYGYRAGGLALPLGNYHNMSDETDDVHLRPEYIHRDDLWWCYMLLKKAAVILPRMDRDHGVTVKRLLHLATPFFDKLVDTQ